MTGESSTWEHFDHIHEILKKSKLVNLSLCMNERFGKECGVCIQADVIQVHLSYFFQRFLAHGGFGQ